MIVHPPAIRQTRSGVRLQARVQLQAGSRTTRTLWFETEPQFASHLSPRLDPFACFLFFIAQRLGEDLVLEGPIDERVADGIEECIPLIANWRPDLYKKIRLNAPERVPVPATNAPAGAAFSGGTDSFYTLQRRLPGPVDPVLPSLRRVAFVHGFDIPLRLRRHYDQCLTIYRREVEPHGVSIVPVATNIRAMQAKTPWDDLHNPCLAGIAHLFPTLWSLFLIPSSYTSETGYESNGAHPFFHLMLSGGAVQVRTDGLDHGSTEKMCAVADWDVAHRSLRVCYEEVDGVMNCGRCRKCARRMVQLKIMGCLDRFETFKAPLTSSRVRTTRWGDALFPNRALWLMRIARKNGNHKIWFDLLISWILERPFVLLRRAHGVARRSRQSLRPRLRRTR